MNKNILLSSAILMALSTTVYAADPATPEEPEQIAPKVYGQLNVQYEKLSNLNKDLFKNGQYEKKDSGVRVGRASIGVKGPLEYGNLKINYNVEAEFSDVANPNPASDKKDVRVRTAMITIPTKTKGTFLAGTGYSGQRADLYGHLDIFDNVEKYNREKDLYSMSSGLTAQSPYSPGVLAYKTPVFKDFYGVGALVSAKDDNGKSTDASLARIIYKKDKVLLGAGITNTNKSAVSATATKDYVRTALAASYTADKWQVGTTYENNKDHPTGDFTVLGVAGAYKVTPKASVKLGYFKKDHDNNALDNKAIISNVSYALGNSPKQGKSAKLYIENEKHDIKANDKTTIGVALKF